MRYSLAPLGKDRYYRRYWVFKSLPGLFVEDDDQFVEQLVGSIQIKNEISDNKMNISVYDDVNISSIEHKVSASPNTSTTCNVGKENNPLISNANGNTNTSILNCSNILSNSYFNTSDLKINHANFSKNS